MTVANVPTDRPLSEWQPQSPEHSTTLAELIRLLIGCHTQQCLTFTEHYCRPKKYK